VSQLEHACGFKELVVYQKARIVAGRIFEITKAFPKEEMYSLTDQVRRSSRSIGAQIAEAWAMRRYEKHFVSKLTDADGEQQETQHWIESALDCGYLAKEQTDTLSVQLSEIGRMLRAMMQKADLFCGEGPFLLRASTADYFTDHG
jgi:four helix bundle protein